MTYHSKDYFGMIIYPGDMVVYPVRQGSRMWMVDGIVEEVGDGKIKVKVMDQKPAWVTVLERVVIIP